MHGVVMDLERHGHQRAAYVICIINSVVSVVAGRLLNFRRQLIDYFQITDSTN